MEPDEAQTAADINSITTSEMRYFIFHYFKKDIGLTNNPFSLDENTVEYLSGLAERQRVALAEALEENEKLHSEVGSLKAEVERLRAEIAVLKPLAEETQYLAGVLKVQAFHMNWFKILTYFNLVRSLLINTNYKYGLCLYFYTGSDWKC